MRKTLSQFALLLLSLVAGFFIGHQVNEGVSSADILGIVAVLLGLIALVVGLHTDANVDKIAARVLEKAATPAVRAAAPALQSLSARVQAGDGEAAVALAESLSGLGPVASMADSSVTEKILTSAVLPALRSIPADGELATARPSIASSALAFGAHDVGLVNQLKEFEV